MLLLLTLSIICWVHMVKITYVLKQALIYVIKISAVASGGTGGALAPQKILPSSKSFFLLLSKYFDWKDTKLHANYFLYNEKCCFPSYKSNTVSFISINYKSSFFSLCIEIYLCTPCALFLNCFPKLRELKGTHL